MAEQSPPANATVARAKAITEVMRLEQDMRAVEEQIARLQVRYDALAKLHKQRLAGLATR